MNRDLIYLNQFINEAKPEGRFAGLDNKKLLSYGDKLKFYPGVPEIFEKTKHLLDNDTLCGEYNIKVEHYIVSTGFAQVIKGSALKDYVSGIWGGELIENRDNENNPYISEIAYTHGNMSAFKQVEKLRQDDRIDMFAEADYRDNTTANMWICNKIQEFAERIKEHEKAKLQNTNTTPKHLDTLLFHIFLRKSIDFFPEFRGINMVFLKYRILHISINKGFVKIPNNSNYILHRL